MFSQKGVISTIVVILILLISASMIALYFIVGKEHFSSVLNKPTISENSSVQTSSDTQKVQKIDLTHKVLLVNSEGKLVLSDVGGNDQVPFNPELDKYVFTLSANDNPSMRISPSGKYAFIGGTSRNQSLLDSSYHYFILTVADRTYQEIDLNKMAKQYNYSSYPTVNGPFFWQWTEDSQNLVYSASIKPENLPGKIRRVIGLYNINSHEAKEIYSEEEYKTDFYPSYWGVIYYDQQSDQIAYTDDDATTLKDATDSNRPQGRLVDLNSHQKTLFKVPTILTEASRPVGKYSLSANSTDPCKINLLSISLSIRPEDEVARLQLTDQNAFYDNTVFPTPDYSLIAIEVSHCSSTRTQDQLVFYTIDGKLLAKEDIPFGEQDSIIYSPDKKQAIIVGSNNNKITWKVINLDRDNNIVSSTTSPALGKIVYWY